MQSNLEMKALEAFLRRSQRGALSRLADATGYRPASLLRWARGEWMPSDEAFQRIKKEIRRVKVFTKKTGPKKKFSDVERR